MTLALPFFFILGTIVGSFLNVLVLRYGTRSLAGRSACPRCAATLRWYELIPLVSFLLQRGRCRSCHGRISLQYPLVELLTGFAFAAVIWRESLALVSSGYSVIQLLVIGCQLVLWSLLIAIAVYDLRHKIIPDALVYSAALVSFLLLVFSYVQTDNVQRTTYNFFGGPLLAAPFAAVWFFSRGRAMGLGDAKLLLSFPWFLSLPLGASAAVLGFWLGALMSIALLLLKAARPFLGGALPARLNAPLARLTMKTELPLAPFLIAGLFIVYLTGLDVTGLSLLLQNS